MNNWTQQMRLALALCASLILHLSFLFTMSKAPAPSIQTVGIELIHVASPQVVHHHLQSANSPHIPHSTVKSKAIPTQLVRDVVVTGDTGSPDADAHTEASLIDRYIAQLALIIEQNKIYPRSAIDREEEGKVILEITLDLTGNIQSSRIEEASPFQSLNQAALETVRKTGKFPPLPPQISTPVRLRIPLRFQLR